MPTVLGTAKTVRRRAPWEAMPSLKALWHHGDDVAKTRAALAAACVAVGEIQFPFHTPRGEFAVRDPDG